MAKTLDEILKENDALRQKAQLLEYLQELTKDNSKMTSLGNTRLKKEYNNVFKVLQEIENKSKKQKLGIIAEDATTTKLIKKLSKGIQGTAKEFGLFSGQMGNAFGALTGGSQNLEKFISAATFGTAAAIGGFKGLNKVVKEGAGLYNKLAVPLAQTAQEMTTEFGAAFDLSGNQLETFAGRAAAAQTGALDLVESVVRGGAISATGDDELDKSRARFRGFSADLETARDQVRKGRAELSKAFQDELYAIDTAVTKSGTAIIDAMNLQKILGATGDQMGALAGRAVIMGSSIEAQAVVAKLAAEKMGKAFGIQGKVVSRTVNELRGDFRGFGTFSEEQLAKVAAQTRKLGISLDGIKKLNMFDDFDKAAESAAMLGQSFGLNIDAFDLFMEEDPTERLRMIQEAASQAGLDIANMSRVEMNYLSDLTGMGVEDTMKALSSAGMDMQSQLGDVPDVAQTAQEQTAALIAAQDKVSETIANFTTDIDKFPDTAEAIASNMKDLLLFQKGGSSRLGKEMGTAFNDQILGSTKLITSETGKALSKGLQKGFIGLTRDMSEIGKAMLESGAIAEKIMAREMKGGKSAAEAALVVKDDPAFIESVARGYTGTAVVGDKIRSGLQKGIKRTTGHDVPIAAPPPDAAAAPGDKIRSELQQRPENPAGSGTPIAPPSPGAPSPGAPTATSPAAPTVPAPEAKAAPTPEKASTPKVDAKPAGSPPAPAGDVTVNTKSDGSGNLRGEADVPAGTQKIVIMIGEKEVGEAVLLPVMKSQFPPQGFDAGSVGGRIKNAQA